MKQFICKDMCVHETEREMGSRGREEGVRVVMLVCE